MPAWWATSRSPTRAWCGTATRRAISAARVAPLAGSPRRPGLADHPPPAPQRPAALLERQRRQAPAGARAAQAAAGGRVVARAVVAAHQRVVRLVEGVVVAEVERNELVPAGG